MSFFYDGKFDESTRYYEFALEYCDTTEYDTWGNLAAAQYWTDDGREQAIERYKIAQRHLTREFQADPENPYLIATMIHYSTRAGDWETGRQMIAYGDSIAGNDANVLLEAGGAYEHMGNRRLAMRYVVDAVKQGYPVIEIDRIPSLRELVNEPVFKQMISQEIEGETTPPNDASSN